MSGKKILFVSRHAPYGSSTAKDALDAILAASAYEQDLSVLFINDGVFQLLNTQAAQTISQKSINAILSALPLYEINSIYIHTESFTARGLSNEDISQNDYTFINSQEVNELMANQHQILSF